MNKREQKFTTKFIKWFKYQKFIKHSFAFEVKVGVGTSPINYKSNFLSRPHEMKNLLACKHGKFIWKISDIGMVQNPFDGFVYQKAQSYVIVHWERKGNKEFYFIDSDILYEEMLSNSKSLTEDKARSIGRLFSLDEIE